MSEIANGFSWYKFDIDGWLSSPDVQQMDFHERVVYHHLLTIQARDGRLAAEPLALAKQAGVDRRTIQKWLQDWGHLLPIIKLTDDVYVTLPLRPCNAHAPQGLLTCNVCAPPPLPIRCVPAAYWMRTGSVRANPKLWNLSVKSGKFEGQPLIEENRRETDIDTERDREKRERERGSKAPTPSAKGQGF
jgi:hypothetical protein